MKRDKAMFMAQYIEFEFSEYDRPVDTELILEAEKMWDNPPIVEDDYLCSQCNGSGEGAGDGAVCTFCRGTGTARVED